MLRNQNLLRDELARMTRSCREASRALKLAARLRVCCADEFHDAEKNVRGHFLWGKAAELRKETNGNPALCVLEETSGYPRSGRRARERANVLELIAGSFWRAAGDRIVCVRSLSAGTNDVATWLRRGVALRPEMTTRKVIDVDLSRLRVNNLRSEFPCHASGLGASTVIPIPLMRLAGNPAALKLFHGEVLPTGIPEEFRHYFAITASHFLTPAAESDPNYPARPLTEGGSMSYESEPDSPLAPENYKAVVFGIYTPIGETDDFYFAETLAIVFTADYECYAGFLGDRGPLHYHSGMSGASDVMEQIKIATS